LPPADELDGKTFNVHLDDGSITEYRFESATRMHWRILSGKAASAQAIETYRATSLRQGIVFVDFLKSGERTNSVSMVIDLGRAVVTTITGTLPARDAIAECAFDRATSGRELTSVKASVVRGTQYALSKRTVLYLLGVAQQGRDANAQIVGVAQSSTRRQVVMTSGMQQRF